MEAEVFAQLQLALPRDLKTQLGMLALRRGPAVSLLTPGADVATVNRTIGLGFDSEMDDAALSSICAEYASAGVPRWLLQWSPEASPRQADELFARHGGRPKTPVAKMWGSLDNEPPPASCGVLRIEEIGRENAALFRAVVAPSLGFPDIIAPLAGSTIGHHAWHHYLVFDGVEAIAGAAMFHTDRGAWLGLAATLPHARGRGAQKVLIARRLREAHELGCKWATAETMPDTAEHPNPSYRNMLRAGMRLLYHQAKYVFGDAPAS